MNAAEREGYKLAQAGYGMSDLWNAVTDRSLRDFNSVLRGYARYADERLNAKNKAKRGY